MEKMIILQGITIDAFIEHIDTIVERRLNEKFEKLIPKKENEFLCRKEVSRILKVSLPTLAEWTKSGLINSYRIGACIRYKSNEIEEALIRRKFRS